MFRDKDKDKLNVKKINEMLNLGSKILKILYIVLIIAVLYSVTLILKETKILDVIKSVLVVLTPFFIGIIIAWLLEPMVIILHKRGMSRVLSTIIVFLVFILVIVGVLWFFIPTLITQINELIPIVPEMLKKAEVWITKTFSQFDSTINVKDEIYKYLENISVDLTTELPKAVIDFAKNFIAGLGVFVMGLMIGFYMLFNFNDVLNSFVNFLPKRGERHLRTLTHEINTSLRSYVLGTLIIVFCLFLVSSLAFSIIGLKVPVLFGLIVGITDLIPYIGPYIGGAFAVIGGFTVSSSVGISTIITIVILQLIESFIFQPIVMSRTMKLQPATIIIGLLLFGNYFGIIGMILATPIIATLKILFIYLNNRFDFLNYFKDKEEVEESDMNN